MPWQGPDLPIGPIELFSLPPPRPVGGCPGVAPYDWKGQCRTSEWMALNVWYHDVNDPAEVVDGGDGWVMLRWGSEARPRAFAVFVDRELSGSTRTGVTWLADVSYGRNIREGVTKLAEIKFAYSATGFRASATKFVEPGVNADAGWFRVFERAGLFWYEDADGAQSYGYIASSSESLGSSSFGIPCSERDEDELRDGIESWCEGEAESHARYVVVMHVVAALIISLAVAVAKNPQAGMAAFPVTEALFGVGPFNWWVLDNIGPLIDYVLQENVISHGPGWNKGQKVGWGDTCDTVGSEKDEVGAPDNITDLFVYQTAYRKALRSCCEDIKQHMMVHKGECSGPVNIDIVPPDPTDPVGGFGPPSDHCWVCSVAEIVEVWGADEEGNPEGLISRTCECGSAELKSGKPDDNGWCEGGAPNCSEGGQS